MKPINNQIQFHRLTTEGTIPTDLSTMKEGGLVLQLADGFIYSVIEDDKGVKSLVSMGGSGGGASEFLKKTGDFTAEKNKGYLLETSTGDNFVELPSGKIANGTTVSIGDYDGMAYKNPIIIETGNSDKIMGDSVNAFELNIDYAVITFVYLKEETGDYGDWRIVNGAGESSPPSFISKDTLFENVKGQTSFKPDAPFRFNSGEGDVYYNSGRLIEGKSYRVTSGGSVVLFDPVTSNEDLVTLRVYNRLENTDFTSLYDRVDVLEKRPNDNLLINGGFDIQQMSPMTAFRHNNFVCDRWMYFSSQVPNTAILSIQPTSTDHIGIKSSKFVNVVLGNSVNTAIFQRIEGFREFYGKTVTLSFHAITDPLMDDDTAMTGYFGLNTGDANGWSTGIPEIATEIAAYPVEKADVFGWRKYSVTVKLPDKYHPLADRLAPRVNNISSHLAVIINCSYEDSKIKVANIGQVKLEFGSKATSYLKPERSQEVAKCQRFFYAFGDYPAGKKVFRNAILYGNGAVNPTYRSINIDFPTSMRIPPSHVWSIAEFSGYVGHVINEKSVSYGFAVSDANNWSGTLYATFDSEF